MRRNRKRRLIKRNLISLFLIVAIMSGLALSIYYSKTSQTMIAQSYYENERTVTTTQPLIIIDAGHGGIDPGSDSQGILEKDINLEIALKLQEVLIENGYAVLMTREDDSSLELRERSDFANEQEADLFISLHQNCYAQDESVNGIEVYYNSDKTTNDQQLAQMIQEALINETGAKNRGIRSDNGLVVTRETKMPAVLVETAFISNDYELDLITSEDYQNKVVEGIITGIENFLNESNIADSIEIKTDCSDVELSTLLEGYSKVLIGLEELIGGKDNLNLIPVVGGRQSVAGLYYSDGVDDDGEETKKKYYGIEYRLIGISGSEQIKLYETKLIDAGFIATKTQGTHFSGDLFTKEIQVNGETKTLRLEVASGTTYQTLAIAIDVA